MVTVQMTVEEYLEMKSRQETKSRLHFCRHPRLDRGSLTHRTSRRTPSPPDISCNTPSSSPGSYHSYSPVLPLRYSLPGSLPHCSPPNPSSSTMLENPLTNVFVYKLLVCSTKSFAWEGQSFCYINCTLIY